MGGNGPYLARHRTPHLTLGRKRGCGWSGWDGWGPPPTEGLAGETGEEEEGLFLNLEKPPLCEWVPTPGRGSSKGAHCAGAGGAVGA